MNSVRPRDSTCGRLLGRLSRRAVVLLLGVAGVLVAAGAAWAYWATAAAPGAHAAGIASSVNQGATPTATAGVGPRVTLNWSAGTLTDGQGVTGYIVKRYDAGTLTLQSTLAGCSGTVAALTCTETTVPAGEWRYTITPAIGTNWRGAESPYSGVVSVSPAALSLATTVFGPPLPKATTGALTGFTPNEAITYRLDGSTPITGSPAAVNASGNATITNLVIPIGTSEGAHTVWAIGSAGTTASVGVVVDTVAPTASAQLSPAANGAGWNNAGAVQVLLSGADGVAGSGISSLRYTLDGTDPTSSQTVLTYTDLLLTSTTTVKYYAVDAAGNASGVYTQQVNIDTVAPVNSVALSNASGNAYAVGNTIYYRGSATSNRSFTLTNTVTDPGGSGPASSGTTALTGDATGWTHTSSSVSTPANGPYVSNTFTWPSNATNSPTETVLGTDVAGNTATTELTFLNDSTAPTGGSISYDDGSTAVFSVPIGFTTGSDATVGLAPTGRLLQRRQVALTNGACASFAGVPYATIATDPASPYRDATVASGYCYQYQYVVPDNVGNEGIYAGTNTVMVSTYPAAVSSTTGLRSHWRLGELNTRDTFTAAAGTSPTSRAADNGSTWTRDSGVDPVVTPAARLRKSGATGFEMYTSVVPASPNYSVEADFHVASSLTGQVISVTGRMDAAANTQYHAGYNSTSNAWMLYKDINGTGTQLGTAAEALTVGATYRVRLEMNGTAISAWVNGVRRLNVVDGAIAVAGRAGIQMWGAATLSDTTGIHVDNYVAAPLAAADNKGTNHGTYTNAPLHGQPGPLTNDNDTAMTLDQVGSADHVVVPHAATLNVGDSFSLEAWVKRADAATTTQTIVHKGTATTGFQWAFSNNKMSLLKNGVAIVQTTTTQTDTTVFHHYVVTKNGPTIKLYVDGVDVTGYVTDQVISDTANNLYIGSEAGTAEGLNGTIDEVSFYGGALPAATVTDHHQYYTTSLYASTVAAEPSLLRQYRLGELNHSIDTFTYPGVAGTALQNRVGEFGATWVRHAATPTDSAVITNGGNADNGPGSTGGAVRKNGTGTGVIYYTSTLPPTADYMVDAEVVPPAGYVAGEAAGIVARVQTGSAAGTYYLLLREHTATEQTYKLFRVINGARTQLGTTVTVGDKGWRRMGIQVEGTSIKGQINGSASSALTVTDATIPGNGPGGIMLGDGTTSATFTDASPGVQLDRFRINPLAVENKGAVNGTYLQMTTLGVPGALVGDANTAAYLDQVVAFNGDSVRTPKPPTLTDFTVEFWFKTTQAVGTASLIDNEQGSGVDDWAIWHYPNGSLRAELGSAGGTVDVYSGTGYNNGAWHHVALTRKQSSGTMVLYVDGRVAGSATGPTTPRTSTSDLRLGRRAYDGAQPYTGALDEVALYTSVLPSTTVAQHYDFGMGGNGSGPSGGSVEAAGLVGTGNRYTTNTTLTINLAKGADADGLAASGAQLRRSDAPLTSNGTGDGVCGTYNQSTLLTTDPGATYSDLPADASPVVSGSCYLYEYIVKDTQNNTTTYVSGDVKVDDSAPTAPTLTYANFSNVYADNGSSTVYYRPGASSGSFTVSAASTDAESGIGGYTMPSIGAGWTTPAGTTGTQTYAFAASSPATASGNVIAVNRATVTSTGTPLTMTADSTAPTVTGMSLSYPSGAHTSGALTVTISGAPGDAGSGLSNRLLQRAVAPLTGGTCGTYGSYTTIVTNPGASYVDSVSDASCYKYRYLAYDKVGNVSTAVVHTSGAATAARVSTVAGFFQTGADNLVVMEAENYTVANTQGADDWAADTSIPGYSGTGSMSTSDTASINTSPGYAGTASRLDYEVNFATTGTHYVWVRSWGPNAAADSFHVGVDYLENATADNGALAVTQAWTWTSTNQDNATPLRITVPTTGLHTINLYVREAGTIVDKILLTTNASYTPTGTGPAETVGEILVNGNFDEASSAPWGFEGGSITSGAPYRSATKKLVLGGTDFVAHTAYQSVTIPSSCAAPTLRFYRSVQSTENNGYAYDFLYVDVRNAANNTTLQSATAADNLGSASWTQNASYDLSAFKGQTVTLRFRATLDDTLPTTFYVDDASLTCS